MICRNKFIALAGLLMALLVGNNAAAQELIKYGNFNSWITRNIKESSVLGGNTKQVYEIGPTQTINGAKAYVNMGGSPWATSNVYCKVMGITKCSNAVVPDVRNGSDKCVKMSTIFEHVKRQHFLGSGDGANHQQQEPLQQNGDGCAVHPTSQIFVVRL